MERFELLFKSNFVESASAFEPVYVALKQEHHLLCLPCLVFEKVEVRLETQKELLNHIEVVHPHLFQYLVANGCSPLPTSE